MLFKPWRSILRETIEHEAVDLSVKEKLYRYLSDNPDVDHYLCDTRRMGDRVSFWSGVVIGIYGTTVLWLGFFTLLVVIGIISFI